MEDTVLVTFAERRTQLGSIGICYGWKRISSKSKHVIKSSKAGNLIHHLNT